jgi:hypothetical protein
MLSSHRSISPATKATTWERRKPSPQQINGSVREEELCSTHVEQGKRGKINRSKEAGFTSTSSKVSTPHIQGLHVLDPCNMSSSRFDGLKQSVQGILPL